MILLIQAILLPTALLSFQDLQAASFRDRLNEVAKAYRIEIVDGAPNFPVKTHWGFVDGKKAAPKNVERYTPLFVREFTLLPPSLVEKAKLKRVVFCEELSFGGQRRNAVPDWEHDTLYLEVSRGSQHPRYLAAVIHHEFFHLVDYRDDGSVYKDDAWAALNPKTFKYGNGGKNWQGDGKTTVLTDKHPGFLTHYMTTGVEEDKAELFAQLVINPTHVKARAKTDAILKAKVVRMKALLKAFCPEVNDEWWKKVERVERAVG
jgi:hypothetical protein